MILQGRKGGMVWLVKPNTQKHGLSQLINGLPKGAVLFPKGVRLD